jgi:hypothetical protein
MTMKGSRSFGAPATIYPKTQRYVLELVNQTVVKLRDELTGSVILFGGKLLQLVATIFIKEGG